jgi:predicted heme/steroid binding protein
MSHHILTRAELGLYHGRNGAPAFVAYRGKVYDVSGSPLWRHGRHQAGHSAGADLTKSLDEAPHGAEFLERFPIVGSLAEESD